MNKKITNTVAQECLTKPDLTTRPFISPEQARKVTDIFKILANGTRLRILHALIKEGELCVSELSEVLSMKPQTVSNQLQKLADRNIVQPQRNGNQIYYRIVDPCIYDLIDRGFCITEESFNKKGVKYLHSNVRDRITKEVKLL